MLLTTLGLDITRWQTPTAAKLSALSLQVLVTLLFICTMTEDAKAQFQDSVQAMKLFERAKEIRYSQLDSSNLLFMQASSLFQKANKTDYYLKALHNASQGYYASGDLDKSYELASYIETEAKAFFGDTSRLYAVMLSSLSKANFGIGNIEKAIELSHTGVDILEQKEYLDQDFSVYLYYMHTDLALYYGYLNDFERQIRYSQKGLELIVDFLGAEHLLTYFETAVTYTNIAYSYLQMNRGKKARPYLMKSLALFEGILNGQEEQLMELVPRRGILYLRLADYYLENNPDSSLYWAQLALSVENGESLQKPLSYSMLGKAYQALDMETQARQAFQKGLELVDERYDKGTAYTFRPTQMLLLASCEQHFGHYQVALAHFQEMINYLSKGASIDNWHENPKIEELYSFGYDFLYQSIEAKANIFYQLGLKNQDVTQFKHALSNFEYGIALAQEIRQLRWSEGAKFHGSKRDIALYEGGIKTAIALFEQTQDKTFLDQAFYYAEQSKAALLLQSINNLTAKNYGEIPDSLLVQEKDLRLEKAFLVKAIADEKGKQEASDQRKIKRWEARLFVVNEDYFDLMKLFENQYPRYFELKYDSKIATVKDVQNILVDAESIALEYFVGEDNIYLFRIDQAALRYYTVKKTASLLSKLDDFLAFFKKPTSNSKGLLDFAGKSHALYQLLLAPALQDLPTSTKRISIIPDDVLSFLPMEVFLSSAIDAREAFSLRAAPLLFKDYIITYNYSASVLLRSQNRKLKRNSKDFLGIAPSFQSPISEANRGCTADELYALQCSEQEVAEISQLFSGNMYTGEAASRAEFLKEASNYRIVHLATHSCIDTENPMLNKIFFSDDYITNYELYGLHLNAELAVLSACNTGTGTLIRGEGVMNLAKGFVHAGVPSTVTSLWSVDDCATSAIMTNFYHYLKKGWAKDQALRQAKLDFLEDSDKIFQHPYYWAAFVHTGDRQPLSKNRSPVWLLFVLAGIFVLWGGWRWQQGSTS